jgi:hypothetical protein
VSHCNASHSSISIGLAGSILGIGCGDALNVPLRHNETRLELKA